MDMRLYTIKALITGVNLCAIVHPRDRGDGSAQATCLAVSVSFIVTQL